ncbi:flavin reductase [Planosporangium flavigriseum]|nr:flavin reductase family protein [Planosporangium flavigriseum]NJC65257.1 flavin reductase [Planosporangium flavigriseum]
MFIVTAVHRQTGARAGCLVGFTTQCSLEPDRFLVCLSQNNHTYRVAMHAEVLAVHGLDPAQRELAALFGAQTGDEVDKFARCSWRSGPSGVPILSDCPRHFVGEVLDRFPLGNHTGFLLRPQDAEGDSARSPLMFSQVSDLDAGHPA